MKDLQHSFRNSDEYHHDPEKCEHAGPKREFFDQDLLPWGDVFLLARTTEARLDDQAAPVAGMTAKTFGNHGGDESESSGPVTPAEEDD
ncbi:hypothetical protein Tco_0397737 [Tanacetum coccineum]